MSDPTPLIIIGAATALLEIVDLVAAINKAEPRFKIVGALDDDVALRGKQVAAIPVLGGLTEAKNYNDVSFVFAISSYRIRVKRMEVFANLGLQRDRFVNLIHPAAEISPNAQIGHGCTFYGSSFVGVKAQIGDFAIVYNQSFISPHARLDDFAMVAALSFVGAEAHMGAGSFVGGASSVAPKVKIGTGAMVGMASAAYRDVPPGIFVLGNPAQPIVSIEVSQHVRDAWVREGK